MIRNTLRFLVVPLLLVGCGDNGTDPDCTGPECENTCTGPECETTANAQIKAYLPASGTQVSVNGEAVTDCDTVACTKKVTEYDEYMVHFECPGHLYKDQPVDVNADETFEAAIDEFGDGGIAINSVSGCILESDGDPIEVSTEFKSDGRVAMDIGIFRGYVLGNELYYVYTTGNIQHGTITESQGGTVIDLWMNDATDTTEIDRERVTCQ